MARNYESLTEEKKEELRLSRNAYNREWKKRNKESVNRTNQNWRDENRERAREINRESARRVRKTEDGLERGRAANRKHYVVNSEERLAATRAWRAKNPGYHSRWHAANRIKNPTLYTWRNCKNRAKRLGLEFSLRREDIVIPEFCPVLGIKLEPGTGKKSGFFAPNCPSVDRFDSSKGYTADNIQVISNRANLLKGDGTLDEFRKIVAYMERG